MAIYVFIYWGPWKGKTQKLPFMIQQELDKSLLNVLSHVFVLLAAFHLGNYAGSALCLRSHGSGTGHVHTLLIWWCRPCRTYDRMVSAQLPVMPLSRSGIRTCFPGAGQTPHHNPGYLSYMSQRGSLCWQSHSYCPPSSSHYMSWPWQHSSHCRTGQIHSCFHSLADS